MDKQLRDLNLNYEIIDAVDYQAMQEDDFKKLCDKKTLEENTYLNKPMYACALSHVKIYEQILKENLKYALVLEDDAVLPANLPEILAAIEKEITFDEIISLSYYSHKHTVLRFSNTSKKTVSDNITLVSPVSINDVGSAMAYVITGTVAQKLHEVLMPIAATADSWGFFYGRGAFNKFRCVYPMQFKAAAFTTTLEYAGAKTFKTRVAGLIRKYRIPFLYPLIERKSLQIQDQKYIYEFVNEAPFYEGKIRESWVQH